MNSEHADGFKCRSKGAQFGGDGSRDGICIELEDNATRLAGEVTSAVCRRFTPTGISPSASLVFAYAAVRMVAPVADGRRRANRLGRDVLMGASVMSLKFDE